MSVAPSPLAAALLRATDALRPYSATPRLDAELLLAAVLHWPRTRVLAERDALLSPAQHAAFQALIARRSTLEPVAYILGHKAFYGYDFLVDRRVLVPRPETELLVEQTLQIAARFAAPRIADIGTGSGAIAVTLALELPAAHVYAVDLSHDALAVAAENVVRHQVEARVTLLHGDLLTPLPAPLDIIVSNPPYTILAEVDTNVLAHEPRLALDGGPDGTMIYQRLLAQAPAALTPDGALLLEIGSWQAETLTSYARAVFPQAQLQIVRDLADLDRVLIVRQTPGLKFGSNRRWQAMADDCGSAPYLALEARRTGVMQLSSYPFDSRGASCLY
ncbi:peptide chain release factor N(5)-glutamine methyltransferase [Candidatus Gracilibacteria bacterium]|nr:peptide chain release factor N(5)-glutamine methyltransferase [Candidatus Gracilibacteria bacterium]